MRRLAWLVFLGLLPVSAANAAEDRFNLPKGPGRDLIYGHAAPATISSRWSNSAGIPRRAWNAVLDNMRGFGLAGQRRPAGEDLDYLATYLGPEAAAPEAPVEGAGRPVDGAAVFADQCIGCHQETGRGPRTSRRSPATRDLFLAQDFPCASCCTA